MLPRRHKLPRSLFAQVGKAGVPTHSPLFIVRVLTLSHNSPALFGVSISKKVDARASARNRMRRVIMSVLEQNILASVPRTACVITVKKPFRENETAAREELHDLLQKAKLFTTK